MSRDIIGIILRRRSPDCKRNQPPRIRVLDDAVYAKQLETKSRLQYQDVTLEVVEGTATNDTAIRVSRWNALHWSTNEKNPNQARLESSWSR